VLAVDFFTVDTVFLQTCQGPNRTLYSFAVDGKQLPRLAAVSRIHRDDTA
jgi:hypothetical protein